jgi:3-phenylpropionate/trans-cinnamate dioxygenase ferredoxin reductase subunit
VSAQDTIIVIGAAHAGGRVVQAARGAGFDGRILLVGEESHEPYERPPLSKDLLKGEGGHERVRIHDPAYYGEQGIELLLGARATRIDPATHQVWIDGRAKSYDRLVLTTGARVRALSLPGTDLVGTHYLRTLDDSRAIRAALDPGRRVAVIGGGFIGLETAASARARGCEVTVLEAADRLMGRAVAPEVGEYFAGLHRAHGVDIRLGVRIERFEGAGRLERIVLAGEEAIPADLAIIGVGILANDDLASEAGLAVDNGIVVDACGRTSDANIFAAGDVASQPNTLVGRHIRLESYQNAQDQGMAVGRNLVVEPAPYNDRLWVWSDQYDTNLQMVGAPTEWDRIVYRGALASGSFSVYYLLAGRVVAVNAINAGREMRAAERILASGAVLDPDLLADPETNLRKLLKG